VLAKDINDIAEQDLVGLIAGGVSESATIDYKRDLPGGDDADKREFLADVSSFANTSGGDLIFGIDEAKGVPVQVTGIKSNDLDLEILRLESIIASGLSPRIRYQLRTVPSAGDRKAVIIRVDRSWIGPHRVIFKGHDKFYGRNSAGKYSLDVSQLRTAFTNSSSISEQIRAFRLDRIIEISNEQTPIPLINGPKIILHCIPLDAFASQAQYNLLPLTQTPVELQPMRASGWGNRLNFEGVVTFDGGSPSTCYTQIYRTGQIEAVEAALLSFSIGVHKKRMIPSVAYEKIVLEYVPVCFQFFRRLGVTAPIAVGLTLTGVRNFTMGIDDPFIPSRGFHIDRDTLLLPDTIATDLSVSPSRLLKPLFDLIWNACGFPSSRNFDLDGNWIGRM
jgi:hypothetical protein